MKAFLVKNTQIIVLAIVGMLFLALCTGCSRKSSHEPVTLTFLDVEWEAPDQLPALAEDLKDFTRETGIQVKRLPGPDSPLRRLALWRELLQKGAGAPDVCSFDVIWPGVLSQYLLDLKPLLGAELSSQDPVVRASYMVGEKLVAVPHHPYVGVLLYRTDLLQRYGYAEPPKTWEELEQMAGRIQAGERARGDKEFWGYAWQGAAVEDLTCGGLEWQRSEGGGNIIEDDGTVSVNNPQTTRAWQRAARWVGSISPPGVVAYGKWDAENLWASGKAAFLRGWASDFSLIASHIPPGNATQMGVTSVPGGKAGRKSALGGNGLAISKASAHPREALELIRFLRRRDAQLMRAHEHSEAPKELRLYELPLLLKPFGPVAARSRGGEVVSRPSVVAGEKYEDVSKAYITAVHSVLTGEMAAGTAAATLENQLIQITGFKPGLPRRH